MTNGWMVTFSLFFFFWSTRSCWCLYSVFHLTSTFCCWNLYVCLLNKLKLTYSSRDHSHDSFYECVCTVSYHVYFWYVLMCLFYLCMCFACAVGLFDLDWYQQCSHTINHLYIIVVLLRMRVCLCDIWSIVFYYAVPKFQLLITYDCRITQILDSIKANKFQK